MININDIKPCGARVLVKIFEDAQTTKTGLILPEKDITNMPVMGKVIKAGETSAFPEGTTVLFRKYSLDELKFIAPEGEVRLHLLEDEEIVATLQANE